MAKTVLIVEDDSLNRKLFNDILQANGYETVLSSDGTDILKTVKEKGVDLVVMDIQLPGRSGLELTKLIREDEELSGLPVIAVTAISSQGEEVKLIDAGCNACVEKPVSIPVLLATVAKQLSSSASQSP